MIYLTTEQAQQIEDALDSAQWFASPAWEEEHGEALSTIRSARAQANHSGEANEMVAEQSERRPQNCGTTYCSCIECPYKECVQDKKQCINGCLTNKTTKALRLAEEAFEALVHTPIAGHIWTGKCNPALFAIRAARAQEQAEQEPVGVVEGSDEWGIAGVLVAGVPIGTKLYAAPVRTKDLTDEEIFKTNKTELPDCQDLVDFARAVIAADREKNNG